MAELGVLGAECPLQPHAQALQAAQRPRKEVQHRFRSRGCKEVFHHAAVRPVEGRPEGVGTSADHVALMPVEDFHDTVERVVEKMSLHVRRLSIDHQVSHLLRLLNEDPMHTDIKILPGENPGRNLPLLLPLRAIVWRHKSMRNGKYTMTSVLFQEPEKMILVCGRFAVLVESIFQDVTHCFWLGDQHGHVFWIPQTEKHLADGMFSVRFSAHVVQPMHVL
mmetsp:Transcript_50648/g.134908  ORF Transcript_50648/g.134908 Transcript_50648/m.134908 type:complete len:221 (-) Transcript_50648:259-921(-)